jgi:hypothetical protein
VCTVKTFVSYSYSVSYQLSCYKICFVICHISIITVWILDSVMSLNEKGNFNILVSDWRGVISVCIALGYVLDDRGSRVRFPAGAGNFLFTTASRTALGPTQPHIQWVPGALSLGIKRPGREANHSSPSNAEVKEWVELYFHSPNTPSWRGAQLKHRDNSSIKLAL